MERLVDRLAASPFVRRLDALPGPVWALGAYGFDRAVRIAGPLLSGGFGAWDAWNTAAISAASCAAALLPLGLFAAMAARRTWALPLASAYAGLKALASLVTCGLQLVHLRAGGWQDLAWFLSAVAGNLLWAAAALALLLYFERSERIARLFPRERRRMVPWAVAAMAVVLLATGG